MKKDFSPLRAQGEDILQFPPDPLRGVIYPLPPPCIALANKLKFPLSSIFYAILYPQYTIAY